MNARIPIAGFTANTLIMDIKTGELIAINHCNLYTEPAITVRFVSNGQDITDSISEQSKQAVLKANVK